MLVLAGSANAQEQLARVGFLQFTNIEANENIAYLGGSIFDALAKSMYAKFQYNQVENTQIKESFVNIMAVRVANKKTSEVEMNAEFLPDTTPY